MQTCMTPCVIAVGTRTLPSLSFPLLELLLLLRLGANLQPGASRQVSELVRSVLDSDQLHDHQPHVCQRLSDLLVLRQEHSTLPWHAVHARHLRLGCSSSLV